MAGAARGARGLPLRPMMRLAARFRGGKKQRSGKTEKHPAPLKSLGAVSPSTEVKRKEKKENEEDEEIGERPVPRREEWDHEALWETSVQMCAVFEHGEPSVTLPFLEPAEQPVPQPPP